MKFKVHLDLKQYDTAVKKLAKGGEKYLEEALQIIKKHRLYK
jgi:hypothetical protein